MPGPMGPGGPGFGPRGFLTEEEKKNMPGVDMKLLKRIFGYLKPYWVQFLFVFIAILLSAVIGLLPSIITGKIVDDALVGQDMSLLIKLLIAAFVTLAVSQIIGVLENYINAWISQRIIFDMKNQMYHHLQYMPHSFFTTEKQGDIITRMDTDISGVSSIISNTLANVVGNIATVITSVVALFTMNWKLAIVGILIIPLLILPTKRVGKRQWLIRSKAQKKNDEMNQLINETLSVSGSMLVKLFTREEKEYERFKKVNEESVTLNMKEQRSGSWFHVVMGMFIQVGPLLIYFAGGYLIISKIDAALSVGTITAMVALVNRLYRPVQDLLNLQVEFTRSLALFTRIFEYFDMKNDIESPENGSRADITNKDIRFDHVAFGYGSREKNSENEDKSKADDKTKMNGMPEMNGKTEGDIISDALVLKDIDFTVPGGKMYAIVGPSGSGKSTVVNLIPRLYDVLGGSVSIGGTDVRDYDLQYLRKCIGMVTQDTYLFNGSIKDNLLYAKDDATDEEIIDACQKANIHDFIVSQPEGYNAQVGNRGLKLSGGEKQRLSIARVILKNPKILILDEATSALDSISESAIQDALEMLMKGRTSIVIAHRLSTILMADTIMVVKDGVIKEKGTHQELLELGGVYKELYETQFKKALELEGVRKPEGAGSSENAVKPEGAKKTE